MRALVVGRWYPAYDDPVRGSFVADHCRALRDAGVDLRIASWESAVARRSVGARDLERIRASWAALAGIEPPFARPRSWGVPAIPVARLPAVVRPGDPTRRDEGDQVHAHEAALLTVGAVLDRSWPIDLIHAHAGLPDGAAAATLADRLGVPLMVTEHDRTIEGRLAVPEACALYGRLVGRGRRIVAVSRVLAERLRARLPDLPAGAITVIPNPVPLDVFPLGDPAARDVDELLWVGGRQANKGLATLLEAFALVRAARPSLRLRLIGRAPSDEEEAAWRRRARELGIADAVSFDPPADRATVAGAMRRAAVFVHPSHWETFGVVAAEALASGLPVAAMRSGGVDEILGEDGSLGELADGPDAAAFAAAIGGLLDRRTDLDPATLRERVATRYAPSAVARATLELYTTLEDELPRRADPAADAGPRPRRDRRSSPRPATSPAVSDGHRDLPRIIVGLHGATVARRIDRLPPDLRSRLRVLVDGPAPGGGWSGWVPIIPDRSSDGVAAGPSWQSGGVRRSMRHPLQALRRRSARRGLVRRRDALRVQVLARLVRAEADASVGRVEVVAVDAEDARVVLDAGEAGMDLAPAGLRWLADRWDESHARDDDAR